MHSTNPSVIATLTSLLALVLLQLISPHGCDRRWPSATTAPTTTLSINDYFNNLRATVDDSATIHFPTAAPQPPSGSQFPFVYQSPPDVGGGAANAGQHPNRSQYNAGVPATPANVGNNGGGGVADANPSSSFTLSSSSSSSSSSTSSQQGTPYYAMMQPQSNVRAADTSPFHAQLPPVQHPFQPNSRPAAGASQDQGSPFNAAVPLRPRLSAHQQPQRGIPLQATVAHQQPSRNQGGEINELSEPVIDFAWNVFRNAKQANRVGNLVLSPLLLQTTLAMMQTAATGQTYEQIGEVINNVRPQQLQTLSRNIVTVSAANGAHNQLGMAAAIFADRSLSLNQSFVGEAQSRAVDVLSVDFANEDEAVYTINNWVANATKNNIKNLLQAASLVDQSLILTNAIYFRGLWKYEFNMTEPGKFHTSEQLQNDVTFMRTEQLLRMKEFQTAAGVQGHWVEVPYKGNDFSMILIVPKERFGVEQLLRTMRGSDISDIIDLLTLSYRRLVDLRMPKFTVETSFSLVNTLLKMGLVDLFTINSQLPHLTTNHRPLMIGDILQKAVLRCDELGSEATVAQSVSVVTLSISDVPLKSRVNIDEPFLALIVDRVNRVPLFLAKIQDP